MPIKPTRKTTIFIGAVLVWVALNGVMASWAHENTEMPPPLATMETMWLHETYEAEGQRERLSRLEVALFGKDYGEKPEDQRLKALQEMYVRYRIQATEPQPTGIAPPRPVAMMHDAGDGMEVDASAVSAEPVEEPQALPPPVSPPILGALEQVVWNRRFDNQPDEDRVNRLEWKTFLTTFPTQPLDERLDRLVKRYPQAIEYARSVVQYQQSQSAQHNAMPQPYTPSQVRPAIKP